MAISASGMMAATVQFNVAAANTVNALTPVSPAAGNGNQAATVQQSGMAGMALSMAPIDASDPAGQIVSMIEARACFMANLAAFKQADRMTKTLLDAIA